MGWGLTAVVVVLVGVVIYRLRSPLEPVVWKTPSPLPKLEGPLAPNHALSKARFLHVHQHDAPESLAVDEETGSVYASLGDGRVVEFDSKGEFVRNLFFVGSYVSKTTGNVTLQLLQYCREEMASGRLPWHAISERACGRPLGIRLRKEDGEKFLYFIDGHFGILKIYLNGTLAQALVTRSTPITLPPTTASDKVDPVAVLPIRFFNDLDIAKDGRIFFTDSSYKNSRTQNREEVLDGAPRGRVFQFDPRSGQLTPLLCGLHFPNGIQIQTDLVRSSSAKDLEGGETNNNVDDVSVFVVELARFRLLKVNISSASAASAQLLSNCSEEGSLSTELLSAANLPKISRNAAPVSVALDSAPGLMDNIRRNEHASATAPQSFLIGLGAISAHPFSLLWWAYQSTGLRNLMGKLIPPKFAEKLVPRYGLVIEINNDGEIIRSFHDPSGKVALVSEAMLHPHTGELWLGSATNPHLAIVSAQEMGL